MPANLENTVNLENRSRRRVLLDVDTGTDDTGALWCAATHPSLELVAATATWGNTVQSQTALNTLAVLHAVDAGAVAAHHGAAKPRGDAPTTRGAELVMGDDGLGNVGVEPPHNAVMHDEPAAEAIARIANESPGGVTLIALSPLTTIAQALELEPRLPGLLDDVVVMGGAVAVPGNITALAEANIGHDPDAAAHVFDVFGASGARRGKRPPCLVPLDVTLRAPLTSAELDAVGASPLPGASTVHTMWRAIWPTGRIELGRHGDGSWPCHDLVALWTLLDRDCCTWHHGPLSVDTGRSAAWGATVLDRRERHAPDPDRGWSVALRVDAGRFRSGVRVWLQGGA